MAEGLTVVDEQGRLLLRNPAVRQLLGGVVSPSGQVADPEYYGLLHPDGAPLTTDEMPYRRPSPVRMCVAWTSWSGIPECRRDGC